LSPGSYTRIFGSGPVGTVASLALLAVAVWAAGRTPGLALGLPAGLRVVVVALGTLAAVAVIVWSVRSLPVSARGRRLATDGAFHWVRHPLYAAFLSLFNPALALALDHPAYLLWAAALHPLWHRLIRPEETLLEDLFGDDYRRYAAATGRFLPRAGAFRRAGSPRPRAR
jgi:protein-S-isoprenylcysteine O-methyltransferase Ste14